MADLDQLRNPDNLRRAWRWLRSNSENQIVYQAALNLIAEKLYPLVVQRYSQVRCSWHRNVVLKGSPVGGVVGEDFCDVVAGCKGTL